jgi:hypothetical protein
LHRHKSRVRQAPVPGIGHDANRRKRQIVSGGDARGNVGFHIGGMRPRFDMEGVLFRVTGQRGSDPCDVGDHRATDGTR